jgi:hypothetical protein
LDEVKKLKEEKRNYENQELESSQDLELEEISTTISCHALDDISTPQTYISSTPVDLQKVIKNHSKVFGEMLKGLPHAQDHDHVIHLQPGSVHPVFHVSFFKKIIVTRSQSKLFYQRLMEKGKSY